MPANCKYAWASVKKELAAGVALWERTCDPELGR